MNYKKLYINIINKAKSENRKKGHNIYYESHRILPKSLFPLWKTRKSNLVLSGKKRKPLKYKKTYTMTEEHKKKLSEIRKNKNLHWYTNGIESIQCDKCPDGFWPGRKIK